MILRTDSGKDIVGCYRESIDDVVDLDIGIGLGESHRGESETSDKVTEHSEVTEACLPGRSGSRGSTEGTERLGLYASPKQIV